MAFSRLLGQDAKNVQPKVARAAFDEEVKRIMRDESTTFPVSWAAAKQRHPECLDRACQKDEPEIQAEMQEAVPLANALTGRTAPREGKPLICKSLGLPVDATDDEYDVAWTANKGQHITRDSQSILAALIAHLASVGNLSIEKAKWAAEKRYPELWKAAGDKPVGEKPPREDSAPGPFISR